MFSARAFLSSDVWVFAGPRIRFWISSHSLRVCLSSVPIRVCARYCYPPIFFDDFAVLAIQALSSTQSRTLPLPPGFGFGSALFAMAFSFTVRLWPVSPRVYGRQGSSARSRPLEPALPRVILFLGLGMGILISAFFLLEYPLRRRFFTILINCLLVPCLGAFVWYSQVFFFTFPKYFFSLWVVLYFAYFRI